MKTFTRGVVTTLTLLLTLTLVNCQQPDDYNGDAQNEQKTKAKYDIQTIALGEITNIQTIISPSPSGKLILGNNDNNAIFDETVKKVIDTLDNINYSVHFRFPDTSVGTFFNLVINETDGVLNTPYIIRYKCDESELENYIDSGFDIKAFKGTASFHKYTDYFQLGTFNKGGDNCPPEFDEVGDPISCDEEPIDNGSSGGGSTSDGGSGSPDGNDGSGSGGTGGSGGEDAPCTYMGVYTIGCGGDNTSSWHVYADCYYPNEGTQSAMWDCGNGFDQKNSTNSQGAGGGDCPGCDTEPGGVPVNTISMSTKRAALKGLGLSIAGIEFIGVSANNEFVDIMYNFLEASTSPLTNEYSVEAKDYTRALTNAKGSNDFSTFFALPLFTQNPYNTWKTLSQAEKDLIKQYPREAYGIMKNREIATAATIQKFGYNGLNDKSDAFRHAYYNVINSKRVGIDSAILFSVAHESETPVALTLEKQMDLFNNNVGHETINGNGSLSYSDLANLIYQKLLNGDLRYLSPVDGIASPPYDLNEDGIQDCPNCANGIISTTVLTPTNQ